jgi:succinoglycan biosynthesis protein ExoM
MHIAICVTTFRRPAGLRNLLLGINRLVCGIDVNFRMVVVDNDPCGSAQQELNEIIMTLSYPVEYVLEAKRGLSFARNTALDHALDADAIAFIDDDEVPDPEWLHELITTQQLYSADVVAGPVLSRFAQPAPEWVVRGGFFDPARPATGTVLSEAATNNVLISSEILRRTEIRFDPQFAFSGSEDTDLFLRLNAAGARIIAADTAIVIETVPTERANAVWLSRRILRIENAHGFLDLKQSSTLRSRVSIFTFGVTRMALGAALVIFTIPFGRAAMVRNFRRIARGVGRLMAAFGLRYNEYSYSETPTPSGSVSKAHLESPASVLVKQ